MRHQWIGIITVGLVTNILIFYFPDDSFQDITCIAVDESPVKHTKCIFQTITKLMDSNIFQIVLVADWNDKIHIYIRNFDERHLIRSLLVDDAFLYCNL